MGNWGWPVSSCPKMWFVPVSLVVVSLLTFSSVVRAQVSHPEAVQIKPPMLQLVDPPSKDATAEELEATGDQLRVNKLFLDAIDYYRAALPKSHNPATLLNKIGIADLMLDRYKEAKKSFELSIKADHKFADAYNNLGVVYYKEARYGQAAKEYQKAIVIDANSASFYSNLGAALFSKKDFEKAVQAYQKAMQVDPNVFERTSRAGVQAQLPKPQDRARYDYTVAKLYAKMGFSDRSLEYLKRAMEEGYKDFKNVYKDQEFAGVRKDKRFQELVANRYPALPE